MATQSIELSMRKEQNITPNLQKRKLNATSSDSSGFSSGSTPAKRRFTPYPKMASPMRLSLTDYDLQPIISKSLYYLQKSQSPTKYRLIFHDVIHFLAYFLERTHNGTANSADDVIVNAEAVHVFDEQDVERFEALLPDYFYFHNRYVADRSATMSTAKHLELFFETFRIAQSGEQDNLAESAQTLTDVCQRCRQSIREDSDYRYDPELFRKIRSGELSVRNATKVPLEMTYGELMKRFFFNEKMDALVEEFLSPNYDYFDDPMKMQDYCVLLLCALNAQRGVVATKIKIEDFMNRRSEWAQRADAVSAPSIEPKYHVTSQTDYVPMSFRTNRYYHRKVIAITSTLEAVMEKLLANRASVDPNLDVTDSLFLTQVSTPLVDIGSVWKRFLRDNFEMLEPPFHFWRIRQIAIATAAAYGDDAAALVRGIAGHYDKPTASDADNFKVNFPTNVTNKCALHYKLWTDLRVLQEKSVGEAGEAIAQK